MHAGTRLWGATRGCWVVNAAADSGGPDSKQHLRLGVWRRSANGKCRPAECPPNGQRRELCAELRWGANADAVGYVVRTYFLLSPSRHFNTPSLLQPLFSPLRSRSATLCFLQPPRFTMALASSKKPKAKLVRRTILDLPVPSRAATPERSNGLAYAAVVKGY